jgi:hypothetical protein
MGGRSQKSLVCTVATLLGLAGALLSQAGPAFSAWAQVPRWGMEIQPGRELAQDGAGVTIDPPSVEVDVGATTTVDLRIENVSDLYYVELLLFFDPALLEVVDADSTLSGVQIEPGTFLGPDSIVDDNGVDSEAGEIIFTQTAGDEPVSGSGVLATITFQGKASGESEVEFDREYLYLEGYDGDPIDADVQDGRVIVVDTGEETLTPTPEATQTSESPAGTSTPTSSPTSPSPTSTPETRDLRTLQVWPERGVGVTSGLLDGSTVHSATQVFPFGVTRTDAGAAVYGRTYLSFPLDVFPPGTDLLYATLYVYVDSSSGPGEGTWGAYRVLAPWGERDWNGDTDTWPTLLTSPIAVTAARFGAVVPTPTPTPTPTQSISTPSPTPTQPVPTPSPTAVPSPSPTSSTSPLATPTSSTSPLSTPTAAPTETPTPILTPTPSPSPVPTSRPSSGGTELVVSLGRVAGTWLTWDVTALMRAWLAGEVPDHGLALAPAPEPDADPETAGDLLVARRFTADDPDTRPYLIVHFEVHPVTPMPVQVLPRAGSHRGWGATGLVLIGAALLLAVLLVHRR